MALPPRRSFSETNIPTGETINTPPSVRLGIGPRTTNVVDNQPLPSISRYTQTPSFGEIRETKQLPAGRSEIAASLGNTSMSNLEHVARFKNNDISGSVENVTAAPNSVVNVYNLNTSGKKKLSAMQGMFLLRLSLFDDEGEMVSENTYWKTTLGSSKDDYKKLNDIPQADVLSEFSILEADGSTIRATATLKNNSSTPAFAIRLRLVDDKNQRILPVIMDDNYITLLPGESKTIAMEFENKNIAGMTHLLIKQYNYDEFEGGIADDIVEIQSDHAIGGPARVYNIDGTLFRVLDKNEDVRDVMLPPGIYIIETHHGTSKSSQKIMVK